MTKGERAIKALREAADALDDLPMRRTTFALFGLVTNVPTANLREEADWIEKQLELWEPAIEEDHNAA